MSQRKITVAISLGMIACLFALKSGVRAQQTEKPSKVSPLGNYHKWIKVNSKPVQFAAARATQCTTASPSQLPSPHLDKFITVYVNPTGKEAMLHQSQPKFPVGTVIVKEKYTTATSKTPELMTVMRKHEKGYNADNGDWEYLTLAGGSQKVEAQGKIEKCQSCHQQESGRDFVFRSPYLNAEQQKRLK